MTCVVNPQWIVYLSNMRHRSITFTWECNHFRYHESNHEQKRSQEFMKRWDCCLKLWWQIRSYDRMLAILFHHLTITGSEVCASHEKAGHLQYFPLKSLNHMHCWWQSVYSVFGIESLHATFFYGDQFFALLPRGEIKIIWSNMQMNVLVSEFGFFSHEERAVGTTSSFFHEPETPANWPKQITANYQEEDSARRQTD